MTKETNSQTQTDYVSRINSVFDYIEELLTKNFHWMSWFDLTIPEDNRPIPDLARKMLSN